MQDIITFTIGLIMSLATLYMIIWGIDIGVYRKWDSWLITAVAIFFSSKWMLEGIFG